MAPQALSGASARRGLLKRQPHHDLKVEAELVRLIMRFAARSFYAEHRYELGLPTSFTARGIKPKALSSIHILTREPPIQTEPDHGSSRRVGSHVLREALRAILWVFCFAAGLAEASCQSALAPGEHKSVQNGVELWYKIAGKAKPPQAPVLFLHGGPGYNSYSFENTVGVQLEARMQVIYLDERGSGRSQRPADGDYRMSTLVEDVESLRESLGAPQLTLMGHSFGGTIALEYAARYPEHVRKLIILDGASDMPRTFALWESEIEQRYPGAWKAVREGDGGRKLEAAEAQNDGCAVAKAEFRLETAALRNMDGQAFRDWQQFHNQRYRREQSALDEVSGLRNTGEIGAAYFGPDSNFPCYRFTAWSRLTMPALIVGGKYDGAIGPEQMRTLASQLPHARFDEFKQSGHFVYAEQPAKFVRDVAAFVARH